MELRRGALLRLLALLAAALMIFAACGGDDDGDAGGGGDSEDAGGGGETTTIDLSMIDNEFEPAEISAPAGAEVTVNATNDGEAPHTFTSDDVGFDTGTVDPGGDGSVTFTMPDAETEFICEIHGDQMTGTLVPEG